MLGRTDTTSHCRYCLHRLYLHNIDILRREPAGGTRYVKKNSRHSSDASVHNGHIVVVLVDTTTLIAPWLAPDTYGCSRTGAGVCCPDSETLDATSHAFCDRFSHLCVKLLCHNFQTNRIFYFNVKELKKNCIETL